MHRLKEPNGGVLPAALICVKLSLLGPQRLPPGSAEVGGQSDGVDAALRIFGQITKTNLLRYNHL